MDKRSITSTELAAFARQLREQERAPGTIEKYIRDVSAASAWLRGAEVTRDGAAAWRDSLLERGYAPVTVNSMVAAVNQFFTFLGWEDCKIKSLKFSAGCSGTTGGSSPGRSTSGFWTPPTGWGGSGWPCRWRPSAPPASG